jgi:hypothetical protein
MCKARRALDSASEPTLEITLEENSKNVCYVQNWVQGTHTTNFFPLWWWSLFCFEIPLFCFPLYLVVVTE